MPRGGKGLKQAVTIVNVPRRSRVRLLLDRKTCRLSRRQAREAFAKLAIPGFPEAGLVGEWPLEQTPPECGGQTYRVFRKGDAEGGMSNLYFLPVGDVPPAEAAAGR